MPTTLALPKEGDIFRGVGDTGSVYTIKNGQLSQVGGQTAVANTALRDSSTGQTYQAGDTVTSDLHNLTFLDPSYHGLATTNKSAASQYQNFDSLSAYNIADINTAAQKGYNFSTGAGSLTINQDTTGLANLNAANPTTGLQGAPAGTAPSNNTPTDAQYPAQIANQGATSAVPSPFGSSYGPLGVPTAPAPQLPATISSANMSATTPINYTQPATNNTAANALGALQTQYQQSLNAPLGPQDQKMSDLMQQIQDLNNQEAGRSSYQLQQNTAAGVDSAQATVNSLESQQRQILNAHNAAQLATQQGQGVTTAVDARQRAEETRQYAIQALSVSSLIDAAKGDLANAQLKANQAVAAKFDPIEAQIKAGMANLQLIQNNPKTTEEEKARAAAQQAVLDQYKAQVAQAKQIQSDIMDIAMKAAANGATAVQLQQIQNATTAQQALQVAAQAGVTSPPKIIGSASTGYYSVDNQGNLSPVTSTSSPTSGYKFTTTQLNTGAANAATDLTSFKNLDGEVQNFYINSKPLVTAFNDALAAVKNGSESADPVKTNIQNMSIPPSVKTYLTQQLTTTQPQTQSGSFLDNLWNGITGFLSF